MTHELLNGLSSSEAEQVLALGTRLIVPSETSLFKLGDPADRLFLVKRGPNQAYRADTGPGPRRKYFCGGEGTRPGSGLVSANSALPVYAHSHCVTV